MGFLDVLTKPRRIPSLLLGVLCLGAALIQLWLALGPSENLPTDFQEMEAATQETRSVVQESQDLLKQIQEAGSDSQATQRLAEQMKQVNDKMKQVNEKWKRQQEDRQARLSASSRRKRLGFAAMATIFMLIAVRFLVESLRGKTRRESTANGEGQMI